MTTPNLLGISQKRYGTSGVEAADIVCNALTRKGLQLTCEGRNITIISSAEISEKIIEHIFSLNSVAERCKEAWCPKILKERDQKGNIVIQLTPISSEFIQLTPIIDQRLEVILLTSITSSKDQGR